MRVVGLLLLLSGCALQMPERNLPNKENYIDNMRNCVYHLIGEFGVNATEAENVCSKIHRRK